MRLFCNSPSPYARKVLVAAHEYGLADRVEIINVDPWTDPILFHEVAPVGKVPALITDTGTLLTESILICDFLLAKSGIPPLSVDARIDEMSRSGLFQGLIDAAFTSVIERRRPDDRQGKDWIDRQHRAIRRILASTKIPPAGRFDLGDVSLACGLAYLDFRLPDLEWRSQYSGLARWLDLVARRPSMDATKLYEKDVRARQDYAADLRKSLPK